MSPQTQKTDIKELAVMKANCCIASKTLQRLQLNANVCIRKKSAVVCIRLSRRGTSPTGFSVAVAQLS